jgi:mannose-6-phosphate isomerase-like protein (cupin superfamily)
MADGQRKVTVLRPGEGASLAWHGERVRYLVVGEQSEGRFSLSVETIAPGGSTTPHIRHREHGGYYILAGDVQCSAGNRTLSLPVGAFVCIGPGTAQKIVNTGESEAHLLAIATPAGFDELRFRAGIPLASADAPLPQADAADRETLASIAPGFGVELHPTTAFQHEPLLRVTLPLEGKMIALVGDVYRYLAASEDTAGRFALFHTIVGPGSGPPFHIHSREDEAFFVLRGTLRFESDGATHELSPGSCIHLPIGTRHRFSNPGQEQAEVLILVAPAGIEKYFELAGTLWHDAEAQPPAPEPAEIERLIANAPQFGLQLFV